MNVDKDVFPIINSYRLNKFVVAAQTQNGWALYNTATGDVIAIDKEVGISSRLDELIEKNFYVPIAFDEIGWVDERRYAKRKFSSKSKSPKSFTIFTTTNCNARCYYCYEKGQAQVNMSESTAHDVAEYIAKVNRDNPIKIRWFGGEPLMNIKAIDIISSEMTDKGIEFMSSMISNGLLFSDAVISQAKDVWHLRRVQITLDGTRDVYQRSKAYKDSKGDEFERVIDNIGKLLEANISVSIRLNQSLENTTDLLELVDYLSNRFIGKKGISVYNMFLYSGKETYDAVSEKLKYEKFILLQKKLQECGLNRGNPLKAKFRTFHCMADSYASVLITPKGEIGTCEHYSDEHFIGSIYSPKLDYPEIAKWKETHKPTQKCFDCPLYPQCIRIKLCPEERDHCTVYECENRIELIKRALVQRYESISNTQREKPMIILKKK